MSMKSDITIAIAEDHELYREGLINRLNKELGFKVIGAFENGKELIEFMGGHTVEIVLMDVNMPILNGIKSTRVISERFPETKVVALTMYDNDSTIIDMLVAGASGYLLKNSGFSEILEVIHNVYSGNKAYTKAIYHRILELIKQKKYVLKEHENRNEFNETEIRIIKCLAKGYTAREMGEILKISERTIEGYKSRLLTKLDVKNSTSIVVMALKLNLIILDDC